MQINTQKSEQVSDNPDELMVYEIWYTIQGEGPFAGRPAIFIRLAGCNITCPGCDTDYTSIRTKMAPMTITNTVQLLWKEQTAAWTNASDKERGLVVITGGEPFRQNITELVKLLRRHGFTIQIETNGTLPPPPGLLDIFNVHIVCSPKTSYVHVDVAFAAVAFKYVISADFVSVNDGLPTTVLGRRNPVYRPTRDVPIYVQPMDEQDPKRNAANMQAAAASCLRFGYLLGAQIHKLAQLP
jgi:7-carboxy-7-deazaguanine synthase